MSKHGALVKKLQEQTARYFKSKGYATAECGYILDGHHNWRNNIILPEVADYIERKKRDCEQEGIPFPLHKYIHHGLSSQACLFNLLGPLVAASDYKTLREIMLMSGLSLTGSVSHAQFEYEDKKVFNEVQGQPTSIDLYLRTDKGEKVFAEFKFTESEFGTCSVYERGDCDGMNPSEDLDLCYLHRLQRRYMTLMKKHGLVATAEHCPFTEFYQAYRLLLFALEKDGSFLLMHDERNPAFLTVQEGVERGRYRRFKRLLPPAKAERVFALSIQQAVDLLEERGGCEWLQEFRGKYM